VGVEPPLGGDEVLDTGGHGGVDVLVLVARLLGGNGDDDDVLAGICLGQGLDGADAAFRTSTPSGKVEVEFSREMAVTVKPAARSAWMTGAPRLPEACGRSAPARWKSSVAGGIIIRRLRQPS
jgi:hypothetical protein